MRVLLALGGNAMTAADGSATPDAQRAAIAAAMEPVADLIAAGHEVVITHGNGPQVGNLLVKNELAAAVVPPVPLDWCGAQTQATIGFTILNALERSSRRGRRVPPGGRHRHPHPGRRGRPRLRPADQAGRPLPARRAGQAADRARPAVGGPRREGLAPHGRLPRAASRSLETGTLMTLLDAGYVVVAAGGGGIPVVRDADGTLSAASRRSSTRTSPRRCSPASVEADVLVIATDVDHAVSATARPRPRPLAQGDARARCARSPPRATSPAAPWAPRSRRPCASSSPVARAIGHHRPGAASRRRSQATPARSSTASATTTDERRVTPVPDAIEVRKVPIHSVADASELAKLIDDGVIEADRVIAIIGKTEGNGGVNDYTRIIADRAFREVLVAKGAPAGPGQADPDRVVRRHRRRDQPARHDLRDRRRRPRPSRPTSRGSRSASR